MYQDYLSDCSECLVEVKVECHLRERSFRQRSHTLWKERGRNINRQTYFSLRQKFENMSWQCILINYVYHKNNLSYIHFFSSLLSPYYIIIVVIFGHDRHSVLAQETFNKWGQMIWPLLQQWRLCANILSVISGTIMDIHWARGRK